MSKPKIFIAIPAYNGIQPSTMGMIIQSLGKLGLDIQISVYPNCALIALARSELLGKFLHSECTHLFFLDSDISFDPMIIKRMIDTGKDVVAGIYVSRHPPHDLKLNKVTPLRIEKLPNGERILQIHSTGLGCTLISRKAIEETCKMFPHLEFQSEHGPKTYALFLEEVRLAPQDNIPRFMGEDIMFFWRLLDAGYEAWAMVDVEIVHDSHSFTLATVLDSSSLEKIVVDNSKPSKTKKKTKLEEEKKSPELITLNGIFDTSII